MPLNKIFIHLFFLPGWSVLSCSKFRLVTAKKSWFWDFFTATSLATIIYMHQIKPPCNILCRDPSTKSPVPLSWVAFGLVCQVLFDHRLLQWPWGLTGDGSQDTHCSSCPFPRSPSLVSSFAYKAASPWVEKTGTVLFLLQVLLVFTVFPSAAFLP